jgi:hypothetical protein
MQLGRESSNHLKPTADERLNGQVSAFGRRPKETDPRLLQLDLMIPGQSGVMRN